MRLLILVLALGLFGCDQPIRTLPDKWACDDWRDITFVENRGGNKRYVITLCVISEKKIGRPANRLKLNRRYAEKGAKP